MNRTNIVLRTAAWYGDERLELEMPSNWDTTVFWPNTLLLLTDEQIKKILERPVGQAPLRQLFKGKSHPVILVDDLNRPTPAFRVMPFVFLLGGSTTLSIYDPVGSCRLVESSNSRPNWY